MSESVILLIQELLSHLLVCEVSIHVQEPSSTVILELPVNVFQSLSIKEVSAGVQVRVGLICDAPADIAYFDLSRSSLETEGF